MKSSLLLLPELRGNRFPSLYHLQKLFDTTPDIICSFNRFGEFLYINRAVIKSWGFFPEELIGRSHLELVKEEDHFQTRKSFQRVMQDKNLSYFENRYRKKDGSIVIMHWSATWDEREQMMFCIGRAITESQTKQLLQTPIEPEVRRNHHEMHVMLERITDMFFSMDEQWRITYVNAQVEKILGIRRKDYVGRNFWERFPEMTGSVYYEQYQKAMETNVPVSFEAYFSPFERWFEVNAYPSPTGLSIFFRDISERQKAEEEKMTYKKKIEQQNRLLVNILERMNQGFFSLDKDFRVQYWNRQAERIIGVSREEVLGQVLLNRCNKEAQEFYSPLIEKALQEQVPVCSEHICPQSGKWTEVTIYPLQEGISVFFKDIDEKKRAEEELQKLSLLAKETINAVSMVELDGSICWINDAYTRIFGFTPEEAIGQKNSEILWGMDSEAVVLNQMKEHFYKGERFKSVILSYTKQKEQKWVEVFGEPIYNQEGKLQRYFIMLTDITRRKKLEQELMQQQKQNHAAIIQAQEKERAQIGRELHDNVNQVLTTVKLYTELCRDGIGNTQELLEKSTHLLQESINEIRSLSKRLSAPTLGNIRLKDSVKELVESVAVTKKFEVTLDTEVIEELDVSEAFHLAIYRILQEHLTNILKYAEAGCVQVLFDIADKHLVFKIIDDGKGFDTSQKRSGIGITNMISRAESMKGTLTIISEPGMGCELVARFPMKL